MEINKDVQRFLATTNKLDNSKMSMEDIFKFSYVDHKGTKAFEYFNFDGKFRTIGYGKVTRLVKKYASIISSTFGKEKIHSVVGLKLTNSPQWCMLFWAILMAGYKPLLINAKTNKEGTINLLTQSKAIGIISDDPYKYGLDKINSDNIDFEKKVKGFTPNFENEVIFCSSGTTGAIKMMVYTGENLAHQIKSARDMYQSTNDLVYPRKNGQLKLLAMIPFHHIFGFVAVCLWATFFGKVLVFPSSMNSKEILELCQKRKVTHIFSVPLFYDSIALQFERRKELETGKKKELLEDVINANLNKGKKVNKTVLKVVQNNLLGSKIRYCITGGGYLSSKTAEVINGLGYPLHNGFGMTEIGVTSVDLNYGLEERLSCTIGKPLYGVEYKIDGDKTKGELLVRSKAIHSYEIIGGEQKKANLDKDGFFATGDIVEVDKDGNYFIKGRIKDVIINSDGENVFPDELEYYFKDLKGVNRISILGIKTKKDPQKEDITLVAEVKNSITETEIENLKSDVVAISKKLPIGSAITQIYLAMNPLPLANDMKVKRHLVKQSIESNDGQYVSINERKEVVEVEMDEESKKYLDPVREIFSEVLILPLFKLKNNAHWIYDLGGDSMNFFELVNRINEKFDILIPESEYPNLTSINDFVKLISKIKKDN